MQTFQVSNGQPAAPQKFVFVNEHSRHKRVKVVRACEGCRRRKIKCDSATTNTWPCAACKRLKLQCVPPAGGVDYDQNSNDETSTLAEPSQSTNRSFPQQYDMYSNFPESSVYDISAISPDDGSTTQSSYLPDDYSYLPPHATQSTSPLCNSYIQPYTSLSHENLQDISGPTTPQSPDNGTTDLSEQLGALKIEANGAAQYLRDPHATSGEPEGLIQETEYERRLSTVAGSQLGIPPALMPDDQGAKRLFQTYFEHVHPYVPVLCRSQFYRQWDTDRQSLSPLLLEAIFACAERISIGPTEESTWLALANRHEKSYLGTPLLSTVQALLILMKAREAFPKRGYFYKSWLTIKTVVLMAKDLEMHEHRSIHDAGQSCGVSPAECIVRTRIWQVTMACETMIGATQGRFDFGTDIDSIDISAYPLNSNVDSYESHISHQFAFYTRNIRNIRMSIEAYMKVRRNPDWALDPIFKQLQLNFHDWPNDLTPDLCVILPLDGSLPKLPSHFVGNMNGHFQLGTIMLHRPQLMHLAKSSQIHDGQFRECMLLCYNAAKALCRIQEAIVEQFGMTGLLCMLRGMSFTIYAILTCVMLHMIAVTSPEPEFNAQARDYFVRHMRLLEKCTKEWSMVETNRQIDNLRAAFSANLDKPFDLKPSFPYGSPSSTTSTLRRFSEPPTDYISTADHTYIPQQPYSPTSQTYYPTPALSQPNSGTNPDSQPQTPQYFSDYGLGEQGQQQMQNMGSMNFSLGPNQAWNPQPIIETFNAAFAIPPSQLQPSIFSKSPEMSMPQDLPRFSYHTDPETTHIDLDAYARHQAQAQAEADVRARALAQARAQVQTQAQVQAHAQVQARAQVQAQVPQMSSQQQPLMLSLPLGLQPHQGTDSQSSYFDTSLYSHLGHTMPSTQSYMPELQYMQGPIAPQVGDPNDVEIPRETYMSPKEWQQTMATVLGQGGVKRGWE